jgi:hypothetical protein
MLSAALLAQQTSQPPFSLLATLPRPDDIAPITPPSDTRE